MEGIIHWVKNLIFIILFTTLLEMFLPDNNMRKYVRVVMGFFIIMIFITPLARIFNKDISTIYQMIPQERGLTSNWVQIEENGEEITQSNQAILREYYQERLEGRIMEVINLDYSDYDKEVKVTLDDEYQLQTIDIVLVDRSINEVKVEPVKIGEETEEVKLNSDNLNTAQLKNRLSQLFQVSPANINVTIENDRSEHRGVY